MMADDLFTHTCRKQCVPALAEIEIFNDESVEASVEEEAGLEEELEPFDIKAWSLELECMKRRIQLMQLRLKQKLDTCPDEPCVDMEVELNCSENKEICELQKNQSKLQYQIDQLVRCCCFAKEQIRDLRARMCEKSKDIEQLQRVVALLDSWRKTLDHEFGVCLERFEYLKHVKAEWKNVLEKIENRKHCWQKMEKLFVHNNCYIKDKEFFTKDADNLRDLFKQLCLLQFERNTALNERIGTLEARIIKMEEAQQKPEIKTETVAETPTETIDLESLITAKELYENTVPVHKIFFGVKELYPKFCKS